MATKKNTDVENINKSVSENKISIEKAKKTPVTAAAKDEQKEKTPKAKTAAKTARSVKKVTVADVTKAIKKTVTKKPSIHNKDIVTATFEVRFSTEFGQQIFIVGNHEKLGNDDIHKATPLHYVNSNAWNVTIDFDVNTIPHTISYRYFVKNADGSIVEEGLSNKNIDLTEAAGKKVYVSDFWSFSGFPVGLFETKPFNVLLNNDAAIKKVKNASHVFTIKAPAVKSNQIICLLGSDKKLGEWEVKKALPLYPLGNGNWQIEIDLSKTAFPVEYKFGLWDKEAKKLTTLEAYENRICSIPAEKNTRVFVNEGLINLQENA